MIGKSNKGGTPFVEFLCAHHGTQSRNDRELEDEVERDPEGNITSRRQCGNTQMIQNPSNTPHSGAIEKVWLMTVTSLAHTHTMKNPFAYQIHVKATPEYQTLTNRARNMRYAMIPYSDSHRVFQMEGLGFTISSSTYYNTVRHNRPSSEDSQTIQGLLVALAENGFRWRCRVETEDDPNGNVVSQKLVQIFFMHHRQIALAQRFVAAFVLVIDGTFNANNLRLPLLIAVGVTNSGKTFPVAFSYCPSENKDNYYFFFQSLKEERRPGPRRVLSSEQLPGRAG